MKPSPPTACIGVSVVMSAFMFIRATKDRLQIRLPPNVSVAAILARMLVGTFMTVAAKVLAKGTNEY